MTESDSEHDPDCSTATVTRATRLLRLVKFAATTLAALVTTAAALGWV